MPTQQLYRYLVSGGTSAALTLCVLYCTHELLGLHYLLASILAYTAGISVSFTLQKIWTFQNTDMQKAASQGLLYLGLFFVNLLLNTALMYLLVDFFNIWYLLSQIIAGGIIAVSSFFVYKHVIFVHADNT